MENNSEMNEIGLYTSGSKGHFLMLSYIIPTAAATVVGSIYWTIDILYTIWLAE